MRCKYLDDKDQVIQLEPAYVSGDTVTCASSTSQEHRELTLQLVAIDTTMELFPYAETTIEIYNCTYYTTCGDCLKSTEIECQWCGTSLTCQENTSICPNKTTGKNECPRLQESEIFIPNGITKEVNLTVAHINTALNYTCVVEQNGTSVEEITAMVIKDGVKVPLNVSFDMDVAKINISLFLLQEYGQTKSKVENTINATVYNCERLGTDCTLCGALNESRYDCNWCQDDTCGHTSQCNQTEPCPDRQVTKVEPPRGGYKGGTRLIIKGTYFGTNTPTIKVGDLKCEAVVARYTSEDPDFKTNYTEFNCTLAASDNKSRIGPRNISFDGVLAGFEKYSFVEPVVVSIEPSFGPVIGGTLLTLSGYDLDIENEEPIIRLANIGTCTDPKKLYETVTCITPTVTRSIVIEKIRLKWQTQLYDSFTTFKFLDNPHITDDLTMNSILSGGTKLSTNGIHLNNTAKAIIVATYAGQSETESCFASTASSLDCRMPGAPSIAVEELKESIGAERRRRKRSTADSSSSSIIIEVSIKMDGYVKTFDVTYFRDPEVEPFIETTSVFSTGEMNLNITGEYLDLVGGINDYTISIGLKDCRVKTIKRTYIICIPPQENPNKTAEKLEVVVQLGNYKQSVGYVKYVSDNNPVQNILVIVLPIVGGLVLVGIIAGAIGTCKYQRMKSIARQLEKNISDMEMKIKKVFRGEFLEMHSAMTHVSENLVEKGFPYNNYQRYTFLFLFPGEWYMDEHPLLHEPDISRQNKRKVPRGERVNFNQGMDTFKQLLLNKFFLVSVISTMEKQRKFFVKERSIMAGHLSVALLGKMEYFHEILTVLLTTLVNETPQKQQKTLFRRCESITEKMMNNWLALSLYAHVKMHSGSPLYMLFKGTQLTMDSGPIDAVTGDSKYTLSEDKLLRQDAKYNTLTLKMLVDNSDEIRECKVLECDTVSQVKAKCLNQIYVNYPASQLTVEASDLDLQWHWGNSGRLLLQDEDTSSKRDGNLLRLNTMEHYKVVDGSSMALIDPAGFGKEDYANTADITIDTSGFDHHSRSKEHLTLDDLESGESITRWHLVKPDEKRQSAGCVVTDEFYITRLITTKQSVLEYMKSLFDTILDSTIPPTVKFLFDFLDNAGQRNKAQGDALHAWKSQCYLIRFWAALVDKPYYLFDQKISPYVETSMEVISQVLIESCSLKAQQYTKDSSPGKLIFKNDMMTYREKVKNYYEKVRQTKQEESDLSQYLKDLNKFQRHQTHYNRHAAFYSLYTQLKPYMGEILEDLENDEDTKSLGLDKKLKDFNTLMGLEQ